MALLPKSRILAYGGELPEDPLVTERKKKLLAGQGLGEQVGGALQQAPGIMSALGGGGAAAAGGAAGGFAAAAGPVGLAIAAGSMAAGQIRAGQVDDQGFQKTGTGNKLLTGAANVLDPISSTVESYSNLGRDDLSVSQKILGFNPLLRPFVTADADEAAKKKAEEEKRKRDAENAAVQNAAGTRSVYGGLPGGFAKGGLLPGKPSQATRQDATAPRNMYRTNPSSPAAKSNEAGSFQALAVKGLRKALPINAAMLLQDLAGNKLPLTEQDLKSDELDVLRQTARTAVPRNPKGRSNYEMSYGDYPQIGGSLSQNLRQPGARMATTIGGAMLQQEKDGGMRLTDKFDFNDQSKKPFSLARFAEQPDAYNKVRYVAGKFGSREGKGIPVDVKLGKLRKGGLLPKSVIATGALHSEKNQHHDHATAGKRGIPVLDAHGNKLAEVERDEWTLADHASQKLESLRNGGSLLALGRHVQQELLTNTTASPRYKKRLLPVK